MTTRVPTLYSNLSFTNQMMKTQQRINELSYQSSSGWKSDNYSYYGDESYNLINLDNQLSMVQKHYDNNYLTSIKVDNMAEASAAMTDELADLKSLALDFTSTDLANLANDYTGGEITFSSDLNVYLGETLTIDGTQYTFANDGIGNNIDISALVPGDPSYAEDVMFALRTKLDGLDPNFSDYSFDSNTFTFPKYTIDGESSILNATGVTTGDPIELPNDKEREMETLQFRAFTVLKNMEYYLNTKVDGKYLFGGGEGSQAPVSIPFDSLESFQDYYDGRIVKYPETRAANLSEFEVTQDRTGDVTFAQRGAPYDEKEGRITATNAGAFTYEGVVPSATLTGDITYSTSDNTIRAEEVGAFDKIKAGDSIVVSGGDAGANQVSYIVSSVSEDGRKITVDASTPVQADMTIVNGGNAEMRLSYPVGANIDLSGFSNNFDGVYTITGISDDGSELYVDQTTFPDSATPQTITAAGNNFSIGAKTYYRGSTQVTHSRISDEKTLEISVNAIDPAFEKAIRALAMIAEGGLIDDRNPADSLDSNINYNNAEDRINSAVDLLIDAFSHSDFSQPGEEDSDLIYVNRLMTENQTIIQSIMDDQNTTISTYKSRVSESKMVDPTETVAKLQAEALSLEISYSVLSQISSLSLINYM